MNKKLIVVAVILLIISLTSVYGIFFSNQNFEGKFTMDVPMGKHYQDVAYCYPNGGLGCIAEYVDTGSDDYFEEGDIIVYYYNNSLLVDGESNAWQHAINGLTTSYLFKLDHNDGDLTILTNDLDMNAIPHYLVGKSNDDGSEAVFVGGNNLDDVKRYAGTVEFLN